jgi:hypothetical protein
MLLFNSIQEANSLNVLQITSREGAQLYFIQQYHVEEERREFKAFRPNEIAKLIDNSNPGFSITLRE